jgi:hypothetical protein
LDDVSGRVVWFVLACHRAESEYLGRVRARGQLPTRIVTDRRKQSCHDAWEQSRVTSSIQGTPFCAVTVEILKATELSF